MLNPDTLRELFNYVFYVVILGSLGLMPGLAVADDVQKKGATTSVWVAIFLTGNVLYLMREFARTS